MLKAAVTVDRLVKVERRGPLNTVQESSFFFICLFLQHIYCAMVKKTKANKRNKEEKK